MDSATVIKAHLPCLDCGSSDALSEYSDGHTYCFSCETYSNPTQSRSVTNKKDVIPLDSLVLSPLRARGITKETCSKYNYYTAVVNSQTIQVACYFDDAKNLVGQKIRTKDKQFYSRGNVSERFYGQHLFSNGKKLIITEGEIDCLTVSQVQGNKYPCVSLPNGAQSAEKIFKAQMEWLEGFEEVIVMFDMDKPGQQAVKSIEGILSPGKLKVATLPLKDPNECLLNDKADAIVQAIWNAKSYKPDGIINAADLWDDLINEEEDIECIAFPWNIDLQKMTLGIRQGEMLLLTAGTGIGKSTIARQIAYDLGVHKGRKVGLMMLEENKRRTARGIMSIHLGKRLHIHWKSTPMEDKTKAFNETLGTKNFIIYDHFGSIEGENLLNKMRYMAQGEGCQMIILDHISIAISALEGNDERRIIDRLMTQMRSLIEELRIGIIVISHLRKLDSDKTSHEQGGIITLDHLRGSGTLKQIPDTIIAAERNQQSEGNDKNLVRLRLLKCRFTGETGIAGYLYYNKETDRLEAVENLSDYLEDEASVDLGNPGEDAPF